MECAFLLSLLGKDACICKGNKKYRDKQIFEQNIFCFYYICLNVLQKTSLRGCYLALSKMDSLTKAQTIHQMKKI